MFKIKLFSISFFFLIPLLSFSQNKAYSNTILKKFLQKKAIEFRSQTNFNKAQFFFIKKNWDSTLVYSMKQINSAHNKELTDYCHYFRSNCFYYKNLYKESKTELLLISNTNEIYPLKKIMLGKTSLELREFKKGLSYYKEVEKLPKKPNQLYSFCDVYEGLGVAYLFLNQFKKAEEYLQKNLILREEEKNIEGIYSSYNIIANLYFTQNKNKQALDYFNKAYLVAKKINSFETKAIASKNMSVIEEYLGNLKKALAYTKEYNQWKDSLNNQNKIWAVADFEKKFAVSQKQKQITVLQIENHLRATQRNGFFYSALALLLLIIIGTYFYAQKIKNEKIILIQKNKLDELNTTKDQLFSIVSHDLRSSVNALKKSTNKLIHSLENKNYDELDQLLNNNNNIANGAYNLLDNLLHWALLQTKQLYFHKESVHLYSIVQQIEYNYKPLLNDKNLEFENLVSKNSFIYVDLDSLKIVLRNLLDNAIKFSNEKGKISIYTNEANNEFCHVAIEDTGLGMDQSTITELLKDTELLSKKRNTEIIGTGLGMQLCKLMVKKNKGTIQIESKLNQGTKVILLLPKTK